MTQIKTIAFFNNKGGVGKTTLACNFASWLSRKHDKKVIVIDCDPQANATQLSLSNEQWDNIYEDINRSDSETLLHVFQHFIEGNATIRTDYKLHEAKNFKYSVIAAHPNLAKIEDKLSTSWRDFRASEPAGANRSIWLKNLCQSLQNEHEYEYAIIDMGPSLGALNRSILLSCDAFITPVEPSLFSQYALLNIGSWVTDIISEYKRNREDLIREYPTKRGDFPEELPIIFGWLGYTIQQYFRKRYKSEQTIKSYEFYKEKIAESSNKLATLSPPGVTSAEIGTIPYMFSLAPRAQAAHKPIALLEVRDGLIGGQSQQRDKYIKQLDLVFDEIFQRIIILDKTVTTDKVAQQ